MTHKSTLNPLYLANIKHQSYKKNRIFSWLTWEKAGKSGEQHLPQNRGRKEKKKGERSPYLMTSLSLSTSLTSAKKALRRSSSFASAMAPDSFFSKPIRVRDPLLLPFLSGWSDGAPRAVTERLFRRCPTVCQARPPPLILLFYFFWAQPL